jgi:hypothetical protein
MNSKEIKIEHFLVASLRVVQYWKNFIFQFRFAIKMEHMLLFLKIGQHQSKRNFSYKFQNKMEHLLLFQKHQNETKAKEIDIINI